MLTYFKAPNDTHCSVVQQAEEDPDIDTGYYYDYETFFRVVSFDCPPRLTGNQYSYFGDNIEQ